MEIQIANIVIWDAKAFVPSQGKYPNGIFTNIEPIYVVPVTQDDILSTVQAVLSAHPTLLPDPTKDELKTRQGLLPQITGARSWKRLGQRGISYVIELSEKSILLEMSRVDREGRWEFDPNKRRHFPPNAGLSDVTRCLLNDLETRVK